jgi:opacity protein-like surface antigen
MKNQGVRRLLVGSLLTLGGLAAAPAFAGEVAIEGQVGYFAMAASQTGKALFGASDGAIFGGAVRYTFWRGAFVSAGASTFSKDGQRVFVATASAPVQKLGFPLHMSLTPTVLDLGYRFRRGHLLVPYASAGVAITRYEETSTVAGQSFDESLTKAGFAAAVGVEVGRRWLRFAAEGGWTTVPGALGRSGVSKVYGEDDIGGLHALGKVVLAFGK